MCVYLKCFPSAGGWTPGVFGFTETSMLGIAGVNWDLMRIEAGCEKKKLPESFLGLDFASSLPRSEEIHNGS